ncbi:hypothetical protein NONI108955_38240 [Nocardia ninae]|uniref:Uncharacterized protein n=1 Tax=Nocardia ninae NBRC 108245 TaxID=1210091 RepID=A0A511MFQ9_9NOCA|nr:hypothetical protein [Nocardia ninae]GEM38726.1 hypothetical protein NN4_32450 [Nocardia ninae NBRC 108245]
MLETLGLLLLIQGVGGLINNLAGGSRSWFVLNYLDLPDWARLVGYLILIAVSAVILLWRKAFR